MSAYRCSYPGCTLPMDPEWYPFDGVVDDEGETHPACRDHGSTRVERADCQTCEERRLYEPLRDLAAALLGVCFGVAFYELKLHARWPPGQRTQLEWTMWLFGRAIGGTVS